jgi:hypothetical protein
MESSFVHCTQKKHCSQPLFLIKTYSDQLFYCYFVDCGFDAPVHGEVTLVNEIQRNACTKDMIGSPLATRFISEK